jgi:hypothetical protein
MEMWEFQDDLYKEACRPGEDFEDLTEALIEWIESPDYKSDVIKTLDWVKSQFTFNEPMPIKGLRGKHLFKSDYSFWVRLLLVKHGKNCYTIDPIGLSFVEDVLAGKVTYGSLCEYDDPYDVQRVMVKSVFNK